MKTRVYIDGYSFYYNCLKGTHFKWLNIHELLEKYVLPRSHGNNFTLHEIDPIKFFTAEILPNVASDPNSINDQRSYHKALKIVCGSNIKKIPGKYQCGPVTYPAFELDKNGKEILPKDSSRVKVWKLEEKKSDVNVAVEAVFDALTDPELEQIVFVTNDTDILPALEKIKAFNDISERKVKIGYIAPIIENHPNRTPNGELVNIADWTVRFIQESELISSQLPPYVANKRGPAIKPISWFKYPVKVDEILTLLSEKKVLGSVPKAWKQYLITEPHYKAQGLPDYNCSFAELLNDEQGIEDVLIHARAFAEFKRNQSNE
ncbi:hypothetical protein A163_06285 [Vibrio tasmaniensis 1F-267]|uniref:NYN domain-containing protein n=1 Tax=Vibrio tasmaniensis 1F-267 TaxID=1191324 RepID=A0ABX3B7W0_9VIBR|nr:NYN domain-containing protein [Vibrio tasmaniensis]OEF48536.1 hypothetical protein A163_06285 [Vibrio tasmaniensis 1F-267]